MTKWALGLVLAVIPAALACSGGDGLYVAQELEQSASEELAWHGGDGDPQQPSSTRRLCFRECPADLPGVAQGRDCARARVPLRWAEPGGPSIELQVLRYRTGHYCRGQLWLLDDGPGGAGIHFATEAVLETYRSLGLDIYIPQHRGAGKSAALACSSPADVAACAAEVRGALQGDLDGFRSSEAGRDLGFLIQRATGDYGQRAFVMGVGYGTYWAQRYLQAYPRQAKGVILDGVLPLGAPVWFQDAPADAAGRRVFELCSASASCRTALSGAPLATAERVFERAKRADARCMGDEGFDRDRLRQILTQLVAGGFPEVVPGLLRRLDRCSPEDQTELRLFTDALFLVFQGLPPPEDYVNRALGYQLTRDLLAPLAAYPGAEARARRSSLLFESAAASVESLEAVYAEWGPAAALDQRLPSFSSPLLIISGGLDLATPDRWARELAAASRPQTKYFFHFPNAGHAPDFSTALPNGESCALRIKRRFLQDPETRPSSSCISSIVPPDMSGTSQVSQGLALLFFGTSELLGGANYREPSASLGADFYERLQRARKSDDGWRLRELESARGFAE